MFAGYVGKRYRPGNPCVIAINPGGGGDSYTARSSADEIFYPLLSRFKQAAPEQAENVFEEICREFERTLPQWNVWRILKPVLEAAGVELDQIAYLNAIPYRTRNDVVPSVPAKASAWQHATGPAIHLLQPGMVVALGKKSGDVLDRYYPGPGSFCVPRTIGDTYVSPAATAVLKDIKLVRSDTAGSALPAFGAPTNPEVSDGGNAAPSGLSKKGPEILPGKTLKSTRRFTAAAKPPGTFGYSPIHDFWRELTLTGPMTADEFFLHLARIKWQRPRGGVLTVKIVQIDLRSMVTNGFATMN